MNEQLVLVICRVSFSVQTKVQGINIWVKDLYKYVSHQEQRLRDGESMWSKENKRCILRRWRHVSYELKTTTRNQQDE